MKVTLRFIGTASAQLEELEKKHYFKNTLGSFQNTLQKKIHHINKPGNLNPTQGMINNDKYAGILQRFVISALTTKFSDEDGKERKLFQDHNILLFCNFNYINKTIKLFGTTSFDNCHHQLHMQLCMIEHLFNYSFFFVNTFIKFLHFSK